MAESPKRKRGKRIRGGNTLRDIHSKVRGVATHGTFTSNFKATVTDNAVYYDIPGEDNRPDVDGENNNILLTETVETHGVPRMPRETQLSLRAFPQKVEVEAIPTKQLSKDNSWIHTEEHRVTWKSDRRLLRQVPKDDITNLKLRREGSISVGQHTRKFTKAEKEQAVPTEKIITNYVDDEKGF